MTLTRDQILGAADLKTERVDVPEWGGEVIVSEMFGTAREEYERIIFDRNGKLVSDKSLRACLVAASVVDEEGALLFSKADVDALGRKSSQALHRVYDAALRLNGMAPDATKGAAKNS
ncbi:hypothetical protein [uncultured Halomonas sp.]|uniref:hypothetical protein n=1 Tax=uncultured Halomonas sp. TaxID=173971 RepID=UPI0026250A46|nr:hypothetical protein [uncultured Halomonas sp.]